MKKAFLLLMLSVFSSAALAGVDVEIFCLTSGGTKPIRFEFRRYIDNDTNWESASVKYEKSTSTISLVLDSEDVNGEITVGPSDVTAEWLEVVDGKISGRYKTHERGTDVWDVTYTSLSKRTYTFQPDTHADNSSATGCKWDKSE